MYLHTPNNENTSIKMFSKKSNQSYVSCRVSDNILKCPHVHFRRHNNIIMDLDLSHKKKTRIVIRVLLLSSRQI